MVRWRCPPNGTLKMNFGGSFLREPSKGGFGGVIRDSSGQIINEFFGMVDCSDANEAEVHAMLVGCHGLLRLDTFKAIVERDSFCAI